MNTLQGNEPHRENSQSGSANTKRDFLYYATAGTAAVITGAAVWPLINSMSASADVAAFNSIQVDIADVAVGARITAKWHGKPIFINHRTAAEIARSKADDGTRLRDPATDAQRVQRPEWLVVIGICTHLGCIPLGQHAGDPLGEWGGWYCACHGSQYDTAGRIRKGPAPLNLYLPPYKFLTDTMLKIG